jgi:hypothetical protein
MRITCPHCAHRFDVPHRAVLAEAARLAEKTKAPHPLPRCISCGCPIECLQYDTGGWLLNKKCEVCRKEEANGNVLSPHDLDAKRLRDEAVRKRMKSNKI